METAGTKDDRYMDFLNGRIPDGGFLQSEEWRRFQEAAGRTTFHFDGEGFWANVVEHRLFAVGKYWYVPRGPVFGEAGNGLVELMKKARKRGVGWIRIEPRDEETLNALQGTVSAPFRKAPHDMQPKEILVMDILPEEGEILARMKPKTRYNIRLAEKKGVRVFVSRDEKHFEKFLDLVEVTARRDGIIPHPREYYWKMFGTLPGSMLRLFVAEHEGDVLAANLVVFFGRYATYLHGASANEKRSLMAPYLLQWRQIQTAKAEGCSGYDFGGIKAEMSTKHSWEGITRFKKGFSRHSEPVVFAGSYDLVISKPKYAVYRSLRFIKRLRNGFRKILERFEKC
jgi:peptidoglycan pentaglycine glycine transferase (the first glycine)